MKRRATFQDLTGRVFGHLRVEGQEPSAMGKTRWRCKCQCGVVIITRADRLKGGRVKSCGCYKVERLKRDNTRHGLSGTPTYRSWIMMKRRCYDSNHQNYHHYGGRGIRVCDRWLNSFDNFLEDMGERGPGLSLDRYPNPNGNYEPSNCRWATRSQQQRNKKCR